MCIRDRITGTTGFAQFTLPYGLELIPTLSYVYAVLGQPAYPESYGTTVSPSLTLTTEVLGQSVSSESLSPTLTYTSQVTGQPVGPESYTLSLQPKLILDSPGTFILTETVYSTSGAPSVTSASASAGGSVSLASTNSVSESVYGSAGTNMPAYGSLSPSLTYTYSVS